MTRAKEFWVQYLVSVVVNDSCKFKLRRNKEESCHVELEQCTQVVEIKSSFRYSNLQSAEILITNRPYCCEYKDGDKSPNNGNNSFSYPSHFHITTFSVSCLFYRLSFALLFSLFFSFLLFFFTRCPLLPVFIVLSLYFFFLSIISFLTR